MPYQYSITNSHLALHSSQGRGFFSLHFCPWNLASKDQQMPQTADSKTCYISCYFHFLLYPSTEDTSSMPNTYHPPLATWGKRSCLAAVSLKEIVFITHSDFCRIHPHQVSQPPHFWMLEDPQLQILFKSSLVYCHSQSRNFSPNSYDSIFPLFFLSDAMVRLFFCNYFSFIQIICNRPIIVLKTKPKRECTSHQSVNNCIPFPLQLPFQSRH